MNVNCLSSSTQWDIELKVFLKPMPTSCCNLVFKPNPSVHLQQRKWLQTICIGCQLLLSIPFGKYIQLNGWLRHLINGRANLFNNCHYTAFTNGKGGAQLICCYIMVNAHQFIDTADVVTHHCSASVMTPRFVKQCCTSCFSLFNSSYPVSNSIHDHGCFTIHSG